MSKLILILVLVSQVAVSSPLQTAAEIELEVTGDRSKGLTRIVSRIDKSLDSALKLAAAELRKVGYYWEGDEILREWNSVYKGSIYTREIGDHKPFSEWLREKYEIIEFILGIEVCKKTHLSDIKTLNHGIPVVINPCSFPMDDVKVERKEEFRNHLSGDSNYYGVLPVVTYWTAYTGCTIGTLGTGYIVICGLAGNVSERLISMVSDDVSDKIFKGVCQ